MSTATPRPPPIKSISLPLPSPSRSNPFARPALPTAASGSFTRACLLPTLPSPIKPNDGTPVARSDAVSEYVGSAEKVRSAWRMLWRGGLEIGREGFRLEGITFFALLNFPSTPTGPIPNPFDAPISTPSHLPNPTSTHSPFSLPSADTDICLSLESMRGRRYLHVRGMKDLSETDILEDGGGVQMSISPTSYILIAYFTNLLCRSSELTSTGRTKRAVLIGLGDDDTPHNTLLVYGQHQPLSSSLKLLVSRRKPPAPPPSIIKVRPGEPLPRVPLFFPANARKPLPFPNRSSLAKSKSFQRSHSVSSIYAPPPPPVIAEVKPIGPISGRTPGRRGEKRPRSSTDDEERRRKSGKVVMVKEEPLEIKPKISEEEIETDIGEDIFGTRPQRVEGGPSSDGTAVGETSTSAKKRVRVPQQVLDNKALIRKQAMVVMESRGYSRDHEIFKDVFAMTTKGVYFVFRDALLDAPLDKAFVQSFVNRHLDMYLPTSGRGSEASGEDTLVDDEPLVSIKEEDQESQGGMDVKGILPIGLLDPGLGGAGDTSRRSSFGRTGSRIMDVVQEEDEG